MEIRNAIIKALEILREPAINRGFDWPTKDAYAGTPTPVLAEFLADLAIFFKEESGGA